MSSRRSGFSSTPGSTGLIVAGAGGVAHATAGIQFDVLGSIYCADATTDVAPNDLYIAAAGAFATATGANRTPGTVHYLTGVPTNGGTVEGAFTWERNYVMFTKLQPTSAGVSVWTHGDSVQYHVPSTAKYFSWFFDGWTGTNEHVRLSMSGNDAIFDNITGGALYMRNALNGANVTIQNTATSGGVLIQSTGSNSYCWIYGYGQLMDVSGNVIFKWGDEPVFTVSTVNFATDANTTATAAQYRNRVLRLTSSGSLTGTRSLVLPLTAGANHMVHNVTTGGQSIQVIGASGTGVTIANGAKAEVYSDGTNWY